MSPKRRKQAFITATFNQTRKRVTLQSHTAPIVLGKSINRKIQSGMFKPISPGSPSKSWLKHSPTKLSPARNRLFLRPESCPVSPKSYFWPPQNASKRRSVNSPLCSDFPDSPLTPNSHNSSMISGIRALGNRHNRSVTFRGQ